MENSLKKDYQKTVNSDGTVDFSFGGQRGAGSYLPLLVFLVIPSCAVTYPLLGAIVPKKAEGGQIILIWSALAVVVWGVGIFLSKQFANQPNLIKVTPRVGIALDGKTLLFKDIKQFKVIDREFSSTNKNTAYASAISHGKEIKLSSYISEELASRVCKELSVMSGHY